MEIEATAEVVRLSKKERDALYRAKNRAKILEKQRAWKAANPEKVQANRARYNNANRELINKKSAANYILYYEKNKEAIKALKREAYFSNPEKHLAKAKAWSDANKERRKELSKKYGVENKDSRRINEQNRRARITADGGKLSRGLAKKLFSLQSGKCACCGATLGDDYHLDHIMPLALGGKNEDSNMQLLTTKCNLQKQSKHPIEFMRRRGFLL